MKYPHYTAQKQAPDSDKWFDVGERQKNPEITPIVNYITKHIRCKNLRKQGYKYRIIKREIIEIEIEYETPY